MVRVVHSKSVAIEEVEIERSGEEELPPEGSLVGESEFKRIRSEFMSKSWMSLPRAAARVSVVWEYHAGLWALKSPRMRLSPRGMKSRSSDGRKLGGQEVMGGM